MTPVVATVVKVERSANGTFRYFGRIRLEQPFRYSRREVDFFVISHVRDIRYVLGKQISASFNTEDLSRSIDPTPDPFSFSQTEPHLSLEYANGMFSPIDYAQYEKPVRVTGTVHDFQPDKGGLYFIHDMGFSGDWAGVEVAEPARYRGLIVHVLAGQRPTSQNRPAGEMGPCGSKGGIRCFPIDPGLGTVGLHSN